MSLSSFDRKVQQYLSGPALISIFCVLGIFYVLSLSWSTLLALCAILIGLGFYQGRTKAHAIRGAVVLVTGASSGLGKAFARNAAEKGARTVILVARGVPALQKVEKEILSEFPSTNVVWLPCDVGDRNAVQRLATEVVSRYGVPDIIVNNAGAGRWLHIEEETPDTCYDCMAVPYFAAFNVSRAFVEPMAKRGSGHFVNVTSAGSITGFKGTMCYGVARWAMRGFSEYLLADVAELGIGVTLLNAMELTGTEYFANNPGAHDRIPWLTQSERMWGSLFSCSAEDCAASALQAVELGRATCYVPGVIFALVMWLSGFIPDINRMIGNFGSNGRRPTPPK